MATFGKATKIEERKFDNTLYQGIANCRVIAINPTKAEIAKIFGTTEDRIKEPVYIQDTDGFNQNGEQIKTQKLTIEVYISTKLGEKEIIKRIKFNVTKGCNYSKAKNTFEVIDNYGNTAWTTITNLQAQGKIVYNKKDGSGNTVDAPIATPYRLAYRGEKEFILFVRNLIGIKKPYTIDKDKNITWLPAEDLKNAAVNFDIQDWAKMFNGDTKEFNKIVKLGAINEIKCFFGICEINGEKSNKISTTTLRLDENLSQKVETELCKDTFALYWTGIPKDSVKGTINNENIYYDNGVEMVKKITHLHVWSEVKPTEETQVKPEAPKAEEQPAPATGDDLPF